MSNVLQTKRCPQCFNVGWVLDCNDLNKPGPRCVEFIPCFYPPCPYSGRAIEMVSFKGIRFMFVHFVPGSSVVASVSR